MFISLCIILSLIDDFVGGKKLNLALRKPTCQSSDGSPYRCSGESGAAVDGVKDGKFDNCGCTFTAGNRSDPGVQEGWWEVNLRAEYTILYVIIRNRNGPQGKRLHDVKVEVIWSNRGRRESRVCRIYKGSTRQWLKLWCHRPELAQFVRIVKPIFDANDALTLCEVEVYGDVEEQEEEDRLVFFHPDNVTLDSSLIKSRANSVLSCVRNQTCSGYDIYNDNSSGNHYSCP